MALNDDTLLRRWTVGAGATRVACQNGHQEVIGFTNTPSVCDAKVGANKTPCGATRKVMAHGPYSYNPVTDTALITAKLVWP